MIDIYMELIFTVADELTDLILYCVQFIEGINFDYVVLDGVACQTCSQKKDTY